MHSLSYPRPTPSGDRSSASRRSHRHHNNHTSHTNSSTLRSTQAYSYYANDMSVPTNGSSSAANGQQRPQPRRETPNIVFTDIQIYDPTPQSRAGELLSPGLVIRATSTAEYAPAAAESSALAYLYREGEEMPVANATAQATARIVDPDPDVDVGFVVAGGQGGTVTVQYEFEELVIYQAGTYCYRVLVSGKADEEGAMGLGVYDSGTIVVVE
ncbi:hypothetical protein GE09DRAFT_491296 [Coniochaeta sp. 2T2.1]|nr:hypothetical protein GE09DRAFT_491296 [Coniochaeta sp. 2T2.1]